MGTTHSKPSKSSLASTPTHRFQLQFQIPPYHSSSPPRSFSTELSQNPFYLFQLFESTNLDLLTSETLKTNININVLLVTKLIKYFVLCSIFEGIPKFRESEKGNRGLNRLKWTKWLVGGSGEKMDCRVEFLRGLESRVSEYVGLLADSSADSDSSFDSEFECGVPSFREIKNRVERILSSSSDSTRSKSRSNNKWDNIESYLVDVMLSLQKEVTRVPCFSGLVSLLQRNPISDGTGNYNQEKNQKGKRKMRKGDDEGRGGGGRGNSVRRILEVLGGILVSLQAEKEGKGEIEKVESKFKTIDTNADENTGTRFRDSGMNEEVDTYPVRKRRKLGGKPQIQVPHDSEETLSLVETRLDQISEEYHRLENDYIKLVNLHGATCKELEALKSLVSTRIGLRKSQSRTVPEESDGDGDWVDSCMDAVSLTQVTYAMDCLDQDISSVVEEFLSQNSNTENLSSHIHTLFLQRHLLSPSSTKEVITEDAKTRYLTHLIWKQLHNFIFQCTPFSHLHKEMNKVYKYFGICDILTDFKSATLSPSSPPSIYDSFLTERTRIEKKVIMFIAKIIHVTCHSYPSSPSSSLLPLSPLTPVPFDTTIWTNLITVTTDAIVQSLSVYSSYGYNDTMEFLNNKSDLELRMDEEDELNLKREVRVLVQDALKLYMLTKCVGIGDRVHEEDCGHGLQCEVVLPDENSKLTTPQKEWFDTQTQTFRDAGIAKTLEKDGVVDGELGLESSECRRTRIRCGKREIIETVAMVLVLSPAIVISSRGGDMPSLVRRGSVVIS